MQVLQLNTAVLARAAVLAVGIVCASAAGAVDIYKWEDEKGQVFVSDVVPAKYKKTATRIEVRSPEGGTPAATAKAKAPEPNPAPAEAAKKAVAPTAAPKPATETSAAEATDCETLQRLYRESQECFAPFRNATGGIKPEAYEKCKERPEPTENCPVQQGK